MVRFSVKLMALVLCLGCTRDNAEHSNAGTAEGDRMPPADQLFVQLGDQSWEFVYSMGFTVYFFDDGPGVIAMSVDVPEVFSLYLQGPSTMLPAFSVPLVERALGPLQEGAAEANLLWINGDDYTLAPSGQVEIAIEHDRIVGRVAEHNLSFRSARSLSGTRSLDCMVRAETIPNYPQEVSVSDNGFPMLVGDNHLASPQCAALKAMLP